MSLRCVLFLCFTAVLIAEEPVIVHPSSASWEKSGASESITLRDTPTAFELLVRYPAGHEFAPHWHSTNERIVLLEGKLSIRIGTTEQELQPGSYAYLPAKEVQRMKCTSATRCSFYVAWDGKLDNHKVTAK